MKLKSNHIKSLREQKAWSQSHLAEVSGLSLRTIQRIEKEDSASQESVQALASVFETRTFELLETTLDSPPVVKNNRRLFSATAFAAIFAFILAYTWSGNSVADDVVLDISASFKELETPLSNDYPSIADKLAGVDSKFTVDTKVSLKEKESTIVKLNEHVELEIATFFVEDGKILVAAQIIDKSKVTENIVASPQIITDNDKKSFIVVRVEDTGGFYQVAITPHRL